MAWSIARAAARSGPWSITALLRGCSFSVMARKDTPCPDRNPGSVDAATAPTVCSGATMTYAAVLVLLLGLLLIRGGASRLQAGSVRR